MWVIKALFALDLLVSVLGETALEKGADCQGDVTSAELYVTTSAKTVPRQGLEEEHCPKDDIDGTCSCEKKKYECNCKNDECNYKNGECSCKNGECNCKKGECNCKNDECNYKKGDYKCCGN